MEKGVVVEERASDIKTSSHSKLSMMINGSKAGIAIAIGYIPIAITFGLISKSSEIPSYASIIMSILVFAGASQFIGVNLIYNGASIIEIALTTFILNFRHFLMSSSLSQRISENTSKKVLSILAFGITDETFAVASLREEEKMNPWFIIGLNLIAFLSWVLGTVVGVFLGYALPEALKSSMNIALYSMFIGLLIPSLKDSPPTFVVVAIAITTNCIIKWVPIFSFISMGWSIIISTVLAAIIGALMFPREVE